MASSYTSLLGLVLPVTGELSGNWGDIWNDSGTSLIDAAISGTTSLTTDADVTLTTTDGVANEARQAIILWNPASGTVTRNITAPARSKIYTVINASGGTQSIVIRGAGPTTGVTIIKGEAAQVAWNGSDFVKISSSAGDVTVRNLTVTGNTILGDASADTVTINGTVTSNLLFTDNTYDIGASGATRPRNLFLAGNATVGGNVTLGDATTDTVTVNGYMGVGGAGLSSVGLVVQSSSLTGVTQQGIYSTVTGNSSATTGVYAFSALPKTAASAFTSATVVGFYAFNASKGAGSTITNQHGVYIADQTQGTNNYGITSAVSSDTNKWNIYASGTADNYFAGRVGFGSTSLGGASGQYRFGGTITGATSSNGIYYTPTVQSDVTTSAAIIASQPSTAAASFTLANLSYFVANQSTIGAGSAVTNQFGFNVASSLIGATNNYGFYGQLASGTGRWNLYMAGTAANYLAGALTVAATGANGIDLNANSTDSARLFFSTSTAGQGWSMLNGGGSFRLSPAATAGSASGTPVFTITQAGVFTWLPDTVTASMTLNANGVLLLGTTSASGTANKLQVNSDAFINSLTVGKGTAGLSANTALGVNALLSITTGNTNTAVGFNAGDALTTGQNNVALGGSALSAAQTVQNAVAIGSNALAAATAGDNNTVVGASSMNNVVTGGNNTAIGAAVMGSNTSGAENTAVGYLSLSNNSTGSNNTALGRRALWGNSTTSNNVAIGYFALDDVLTAGNNTAVGTNALGAATGGSNTALGSSAGVAVTTGASNLFLGTNSGALMTTGSNNVVIGSYQGNSGGLDIRTLSNYIVLSDGAANIRQVIDSSGNLGVGVVPSAWVNYNAVQIPGGAIAGTAPSFRLEMMQNAYYSGSSYYYVATSAASVYRQSVGAHIWYNAPSGTAGNAITFTQAMTLNASGNLGVGTTSPGARLDVSTASGNTAIISRSITATNASVQIAGNGNTPGSTSFDLIQDNTFAYVYQRDNKPMLFGTNNTERMRIDASGNLGLGVTPSAWGSSNKAVQLPGGAVWAFSTTQITLGQNVYDTGSGTFVYASTDAASRYRQLAGAHAWFNAPSGTAGASVTFTQAMTLDADGDLGIGTTSPATKLDVAGAGTFKVDGSGSTTPLILRNNNTASTQVVKLAFDSNGAIKASINAAVYNNDYMAFNVGSDTERVRIDNVGNVQMQTGSAVVWAPAPAAISTTATLTNANIQGQIINTTGTSYTVTMPLGTTMETLVPWAAVNLGYNFTVINTASGTITMAVNTGVTSLGALTIATGTSAQFRIRRTAANTFILYRMS